MARKKTLPNWHRWLNKQSNADIHKIAVAALTRLFENGEVRFQADDLVDRNGDEVPDDGSFEEMIYWESSGDDIREID